MKKIFMFLAVMGVMAFSAQNAAAQDEQTAEPTATEAAAPAAEETLDGPEETPMHQALKTKFIEGGAGFMALVISAKDSSGIHAGAWYQRGHDSFRYGLLVQSPCPEWVYGAYQALV